HRNADRLQSGGLQRRGRKRNHPRPGRDLRRRRGRRPPAQARRGGGPHPHHARPNRRAAGELSDPTAPKPVDWRRNLAALWFAEFTAIFGFSFAFPFLSIFISHDLGVHPGRGLDLWAAASASASGLAMAIASPIWGVLGDRYGRK